MPSKDILIKELVKFQNNSDLEQNCYTVDYWDPDSNDPDPYHWKVTLTGPQGTLYENGYFQLEVKFPDNYPDSPPKIKFLTKIYHCNIGINTGNICLNTLEPNGWNIKYTMSVVLDHILVLLTKQNAEDPMNWYMLEEYQNNRELFEKNVKGYLEKYATKESFEDASKQFPPLK